MKKTAARPTNRRQLLSRKRTSRRRESLLVRRWRLCCSKMGRCSFVLENTQSLGRRLATKLLKPAIVSACLLACLARMFHPEAKKRNNIGDKKKRAKKIQCRLSAYLTLTRTGARRFSSPIAGFHIPWTPIRVSDGTRQSEC